MPFFDYMYHSLAKKGPWVEHLTSLPKRGVGALSTVSAFSHERVPTFYNDSKPSKQIIGHKITYTESPAASKSSHDGTQHSELYDVMVSIV